MKVEVKGTAAAKARVSEPRPVSQSQVPGHSSPTLTLAPTCVEQWAVFLGHQPRCNQGNFFSLKPFSVPESSHPGSVAKPGLALPAPLHLHFGFLLQWLSLINTNPLYHFITSILVPLLGWAWTHQLTMFPSPGHLIEENRVLPFSSCPFPSAWSHWHCWDTTTHFEVVCTLTNMFSLQEHLN